MANTNKIWFEKLMHSVAYSALKINTTAAADLAPWIELWPMD